MHDLLFPASIGQANFRCRCGQAIVVREKHRWTILDGGSHSTIHLASVRQEAAHVCLKQPGSVASIQIGDKGTRNDAEVSLVLVSSKMGRKARNATAELTYQIDFDRLMTTSFQFVQARDVPNVQLARNSTNRFWLKLAQSAT